MTKPSQPVVLSTAPRFAPPPFGLGLRVGVIALVLIAETVLLSLLIQETMVTPTGLAAIVHTVQHWLFRFLIAYGVSLAMLLVLRSGAYLAEVNAAAIGLAVRGRYLAVHVACLPALAWLSAAMYDSTRDLPFLPLTLAWHGLAVIAAVALFSAFAPMSLWLRVVRDSARLAVFALVPALTAVVAIHWSQLLWSPAAQVTFQLVARLLGPILPGLQMDTESRVLGTDRFAVQIAEVCSGLEGVGLMLVFCCTWLWYFRREFYFPRALLVIPVAVVAVFLLNAVRIAAIVLIGDAGYARIAMIGFHSQAGWIAFNLVAFSVAVIAKRSRWLNRLAHDTTTVHAVNPTAPYLLPLIALIAAGMLGHALSAGFDWLYPLRLIAAGSVLWAYRREYRGLDWRFSWRGVATGIAVFALWIGLSAGLLAKSGMPAELAGSGRLVSLAWIACRAVCASLVVPLAEELAFRGYLLRRCEDPHFDAVEWRSVRWPALAISAGLFGATHGPMWLGGIIAGLAYGALAIRTNRLGEAVAAHATSNALIAVSVIVFDEWRLW